MAEPGTVVDALVASVDIAPTMLEVAGVPIGAHVQGRSFVPVLRGESSARQQSVLIEFDTYENPFPWLVDMDYRALRTERYKYIHWMQHPEEGELYDLREDPFERRNLLLEPGSESVVSALRAELDQRVLEAMGLR